MMLTRKFILLSCLVLVLAGCEPSGGGAALTPVEINPGTTCDLDGMLLADYPGPKAQIHYAGQPEPVFFCDTVELLNTLLRPEQVRAVRAAYVQDMAQAEWEQPRGNWIDARTAFYVLGSKRHGSMGPTIASFAQQDDARKFAQQWGGRVLPYAEIKPEMVDLSGGALHDTRM
jgi:copper chaperone NosL